MDPQSAVAAAPPQPPQPPAASSRPRSFSSPPVLPSAPCRPQARVPCPPAQQDSLFVDLGLPPPPYPQEFPGGLPDRECRCAQCKARAADIATATATATAAASTTNAAAIWGVLGL
ncbi:hypothetical protein GGR57DRAFT_501964 [Xylariaceae sp. FL1272]|nr:hypothetical protein GGR57DRAFT_501964 [Xylariaceae sp. FL1272]